MLFHEKSLLVISDDAEFLEVVKALPYEIRVVTDNAELLGESANYIAENTILFDLTTANIDIDAVFNTRSFEKTLVLVGTQADMELIARYVERRAGMAISYVLKPIIPMLLKNTIENTYSGQELVEFIADIAIEIKTSLASIKGFAGLLLNYQALDEARRIEFIGRIESNALRVENFVQNLRMTVQLEKRRTAFNFDDYAPLQVIQLVVKQVEKRLPDKKHVVRINVADDCPRIRADLSYLEIVLQFLVENAYLYTNPEGKITISAAPEDDYVTFSVQDNGIGIRESEKRDIFRLFFRSEDHLVSQHYGNGMSLHNAKLIISAHGGKIWFESEAGIGSTFYFTIPRSDRQ